jgi:hypothetical protein
MATTAAQLENVSIQTQNEVLSSSFVVVESNSVWEYSLSIKKDETRAEGSKGMLYGSGSHSRVRMLQSDLGRLLAKEEQMWHQRSRSLWLQNGGQNTKFFHSRASRRKRRNWGTRIQDGQGNWVTDDSQIKALFVSSFQQIFQTSNPTQMEEVLTRVPQSVTDDMNVRLTR